MPLRKVYVKAHKDKSENKVVFSGANFYRKLTLSLLTESVSWLTVRTKSLLSFLDKSDKRKATLFPDLSTKIGNSARRVFLTCRGNR